MSFKAPVSGEAMTVSSGHAGLIPSEDGREATFLVRGEGDPTGDRRTASMGDEASAEFRRQFLLTLRLYKLPYIVS